MKLTVYKAKSNNTKIWFYNVIFLAPSSFFVHQGTLWRKSKILNLIDSKKVSKQKRRQNFFHFTIINLHVQMSYHASVIHVTISW